MPIFLWHSTVMMLLVGCLFWLAPGLLVGEPGSVQWWSLRPVWVAVYLFIMLIFLPIFLKLEKIASSSSKTDTPLIIFLISAFSMCVGLALLAAGGVTGSGPYGMNWLACLLPIGASMAIALIGARKI